MDIEKLRCTKCGYILPVVVESRFLGIGPLKFRYECTGCRTKTKNYPTLREAEEAWIDLQKGIENGKRISW